MNLFPSLDSVANELQLTGEDLVARLRLLGAKVTHPSQVLDEGTLRMLVQHFDAQLTVPPRFLASCDSCRTHIQALSSPPRGDVIYCPACFSHMRRLAAEAGEEISRSDFLRLGATTAGFSKTSDTQLVDMQRRICFSVSDSHRIEQSSLSAFNMPTVSVRPFISYAREDIDIANRLHDDLKQTGATPWLDLHQLKPGQEWATVVRGAIRNSSHFIALISKHSVNKRGFVQSELRLALELLAEFPPQSIFVIPLRVDATEPNHPALRELHWLDLFPSYEAALLVLAETLGLSQAADRTSFALEPRIHATEREAIEHALRMSGGNKMKAAQLLGITRATLYAKIKRFT